MTDPRLVASSEVTPAADSLASIRLMYVVEIPGYVLVFAVTAAICPRISKCSVSAVFQRTVNEPEAPYHHDAETQVHENIHHGSPSSQYDVPAWT
jgi:hypothetical protein